MQLFKGMDLPEKISLSLSYIIRIAIIAAIATGIVKFQWLLTFIATAILILTFIPSFIQRNYKINLPLELELVIVFFIYASLFLGEVSSFYQKFWWWDALLHTGSGILFGFIGFLILYVLYKEKRVSASPIWIAIFAFCFAVAIGAVWEIMEFSTDQIFGTNMQKHGLVDTMWDLIVDSLGALFTSVLGFFYLKGVKTPLFTGLFVKFAKKNPKLFK